MSKRRKPPTPAELYDCGFHDELPEGKVVWIDPDNGIFALVDEADYYALKLWRWRWHFTYNSSKSKMYATRNTRVNGRGGWQVKVYMHKEILALCPPETHPRLDGQVIGDHINGNSLDNRRCNLRWATPSENGLNRYRKGLS